MSKIKTPKFLLAIIPVVLAAVMAIGAFIPAKALAAVPQGDASLAGAVYEVFTSSSATGTPVATMTTNASGAAQTAKDALALGTYYVKEKTPSTGYKVDPTIHKIELTEAGVLKPLNVTEPIMKRPVQLIKGDIETELFIPQGGATFEGIVYRLYNRSAQSVVVNGKTIAKDGYIDLTGGKNGVATATLPYGTYEARELVPPPGYKLDPDWNWKFSIREDTNEVLKPTAAQANKNEIIRGGLSATKLDADTGVAQPQGDATLKGAQFTIKNANENAVLVNGTSYAPGQVIMTITTNDRGYAATASHVLPYGKYTVTETKAPTGYERNTKWSATPTVDLEDVVFAVTCDDPVIRGGVGVDKVDDDTKTAIAQGDGSLAGAEFTVYNASEHPVVVGGKTYEVGDAITTIVTDKNGHAETAADLLPYGTYDLKETKTPEGYDAFDGTITVQVRKKGEIATSSTKAAEPIQRGNLNIKKYDKETGLDQPLAAATFVGAEFEVINASKGAVYVNGTSFAKNAKVIAENANAAGNYVTDETGEILIENLPYGTYKVREVKAPKGYLVDPTTYTVTIHEKGATVESAAYEQLIRGDISFSKKTDPGAKPIPNVAFRLTSNTTGETHILVTDENGYLDTRTVFNPHTQNTNANDAAVTFNEDGSYFVDSSKLDATAGVWFNGGSDKALANDALGALPFDTYTLEELRCDANRDHELVETSEITISRHGFLLDFGTVYDQALPPVTPPPEHGNVVTSYKDAVPANNSKVKVGDIITYTISSTNTGDETQEHTLVRDAIPYGTVYVADSISEGGAYNAEGNYVEFYHANIEVGETRSFSFQVKVTNDARNLIYNYALTCDPGAEVTPGDPSNPEPTEETNDIVHKLNDDPTPANVMIVKSSEPVHGTTVKEKDEILYTLTLTNTGETEAVDTGVYDAIPAMTTYVADSADNGGVYNEESNGIGWVVKSIAPGETKKLSFKVTVDEGTYAGNHIRNQATWGESPTPPTGPMDNSTNIVVHPTDGDPKFDIAKYSNPIPGTTVAKDDTIIYTINYKNIGTAEGQLDIKDMVPEGTALIAGSVTGPQYEEPEPEPVEDETVYPTRVADLWFDNDADEKQSQTLIVCSDDFANTKYYEPEYHKDIYGFGAGTYTMVVDEGYTLIGDFKYYDADGNQLEPVTGLHFPALVDDTDAYGVSNQRIVTITVDEDMWVFHGTIYHDEALDEAEAPTDYSGARVHIFEGEVSLEDAMAEIEAHGIDSRTTDQEVIRWRTNVKPGEGGQVTFKVQVIDDTLKSIKNVATYQVDEGEEKPTNEVEHPLGHVGLSIVKDCVPESGSVVDPGSVIDYKLTVTNDGDMDAKDVAVFDKIPANATFVEGSIDEASPLKYHSDTNAVAANIGRIGAGESVTFSFSVKVDDGAAAGTKIANVASVEGNHPDVPVAPLDIPSNEVEHEVAAPKMPNIKATKTSDPVSGTEVSVGDVIKYTITLTNTGEGDAENVAVFDKIPAGTEFVTDIDTFLVNNSTGDHEFVGGNEHVAGIFERIPAGETATLSFNVTVTDQNIGKVVNYATYDLGQTEVPTAELGRKTNQVEHPLKHEPMPNLEITKSSDPASGTQVEIGDTITYTIAIANTGDGAAKDVAFFDAIPAGTTYVSDSASVNGSGQLSFEADQDSVRGTIAEIPAGETATVRFQVKVTEGVDASVKNVATAAIDFPSIPTEPLPIESNEIEHPVYGAPELTITKSSDPATGSTVKAGDTITYTVAIANVGIEPAKDVAFFDAIPAGTTYVADSCSMNGRGALDFRADGASVAATIAEIGANETTTITFKVRVNEDAPAKMVNEGAPAKIVNVASVAMDTPDMPTEPLPTKSNEVEHVFAEVEPTPTPEPKVNVTKSSDPVSGTVVKKGDIITYSIKFENVGDAADKGVAIFDAIPEGTEYVADSAAIDLDGASVKHVDGHISGIIPELGAGKSATVTFKVKVTAASGTLIHNTATWDDEQAETPVKPLPTPTNQVEHPLPKSNVVATKTSDPTDGTTVKVGDTITYTVTLENKGDKAAENVAFFDAIPTGTTYVDKSAKLDGAAEGAKIEGSEKGIAATIGTIEAGKSVKVTFQVKVAATAKDRVLNVATWAEGVDQSKLPTEALANKTNEVKHPLPSAATPSGGTSGSTSGGTSGGTASSGTSTSQPVTETTVTRVIENLPQLGAGFMAIAGLASAAAAAGIGIWRTVRGKDDE